MSTPWPRASYFNDGTAAARHAMEDLELVERANWLELYRRKSDDSYWRLTAAEKYEQRFLIRIENVQGWSSFDSAPLERQLLLERRGGLGKEACITQGCSQPVVLGSAFCLEHTYERGVRK
ncbi:hypothetical protein PFX98_00520 [Paucibacter sediminis]|uniref:Uncharacterized protein n=1 Tax=Paucibacter sediminis TaxID=3019553 RepID=A0AA95NJN3_9BURK|nr:hypothetical protein [Paucibacter sp. S2-9]WIT12121.1 hypothetical protein PFX98_00520 [Paucibacter sp. S2-9]